MNVRCERCKAVYALDEVIYGGSEFKPLPPTIHVECGRCATVFQAPVPGRTTKTSNPRMTPVPREIGRASCRERVCVPV